MSSCRRKACLCNGFVSPCEILFSIYRYNLVRAHETMFQEVPLLQVLFRCMSLIATVLLSLAIVCSPSRLLHVQAKTREGSAS